MKAKILDIKLTANEKNQIITSEIKGTRIKLADPAGYITKKDLNKQKDLKICAMDGKVKKSKGPAKIGEKTIIAKVIDKDIDFVILDCGTFKFDYLINEENEKEFTINDFVELTNPRLDLNLSKNLGKPPADQ